MLSISPLPPKKKKKGKYDNSLMPNPFTFMQHPTMVGQDVLGWLVYVC